MREADLRLGVDVGATNTDAVVIDARHHLVAKAKVPTTGDVHSGIGAAISRIVGHRDVDPTTVTRAHLGTAIAVDAIIERRALKRVAVVRIGGPLTFAVPPLVTWPAALRGAVSAGEIIVGGGAEYDGRPGAPLDGEHLARFLASVGERAQAVAIAGVFSPVAPDQELAAAEIVRRELGARVHVSLSHEIGSLGLLERENATVLNAALVGGIEDLAAALHQTLEAEGIEAEPFFAQNDGTVMALDHALRFPVLMIGSGAANSLRGAAFLSGVEEGIVADVGGASTTIGALVDGFPRTAALPAEIAGVRMDFRMPDVFTLPLGGGSVPSTRTLDGRQRRALRHVLLVVEDVLADAVDRAWHELQAPALVVVGGAGMVVPDELAGVGEVIRPSDGEVAGAIGAAIAPVSGQADRICPNRPDKRSAALEEARADAFARAIHAGADPDAVEVVEVEEVPLTYLLDPAVRIRVRVAGPSG
jgi:N-methylhydantoinase A/oxoprolinase/acetone carboxylase beta subunit